MEDAHEAGDEFASREEPAEAADGAGSTIPSRSHNGMSAASVVPAKPAQSLRGSAQPPPPAASSEPAWPDARHLLQSNDFHKHHSHVQRSGALEQPTLAEAASRRQNSAMPQIDRRYPVPEQRAQA